MTTRPAKDRTPFPEITQDPLPGVDRSNPESRALFLEITSDPLPGVTRSLSTIPSYCAVRIIRRSSNHSVAATGNSRESALSPSAVIAQVVVPPQIAQANLLTICCLPNYGPGSLQPNPATQRGGLIQSICTTRCTPPRKFYARRQSTAVHIFYFRCRGLTTNYLRR